MTSDVQLGAEPIAPDGKMAEGWTTGPRETTPFYSEEELRRRDALELANRIVEARHGRDELAPVLEAADRIQKFIAGENSPATPTEVTDVLRARIR